MLARRDNLLDQLKSKELFFNVRIVYVVFMLLYALLRQNVTALQPFLMQGWLNVAITLFAAVLIVWDILCFRNFLKTKYIWILASVAFLSVIMSVVYYRYGFVDNIKACINMFIHFFVLYSLGSDMKRSRVDKEMQVLGNALCLAWGIAAAISVFMYFADIYYTQTSYLWHEPTEVVQGFVRIDDGEIVMRLWGVFVDPNFASNVSLVAVLFSVYILSVNRVKWLRIVHVVNIIVQYLYIVLSGSRMSMLVMCLLVFVGVWYLVLPKLTRLSRRAVRETVAVLLAVVLTVCCYGSVQITKTVLPYVQHGISQLKTEPTTPSEGEDNQGGNDSDGVENLDRTDIAEKGDVSNGRFSLWSESFRVFAKSPLFGVGPRSYQIMAKEIDLALKIASKSIHNSYLELLMGNGAVGLLLMVLFFALCAKDAIVLRFRGSDVTFRVGIMMLIVLGCLGAGMFISSLFYYLSGMSIFVFLALGYAVNLMQDKN